MEYLIAGNWKENCTIKESIALVSGLKKLLKDAKDADILVCPPFTALKDVSNVIKGSNIMLGAQDAFYEDKGAFTGEISPLMLTELGCTFAIIGHSERRIYFFETDLMVNRKIKACLKHGLIPIMCIGETDQERSEGVTEKVIERQLTEGLADIGKADMERIVIAYEPVWAIGTGKTATPKQIEEVHSFIRKILVRMFWEHGRKVRILYGGSVKPDNIASITSLNDVNGALVGGASLDAGSFAGIIKEVYKR